MTNNIYTIYNKLSGRYGDVLTYPTDEFAVNSISKFNGINSDEFELCRIGTIDIESGIVNSEAPVRIPFKSAEHLVPNSEFIQAFENLVKSIKLGVSYDRKN